jgi:hypothetical protein
MDTKGEFILTGAWPQIIPNGIDDIRIEEVGKKQLPVGATIQCIIMLLWSQKVFQYVSSSIFKWYLGNTVVVCD